jgi:hypothetical protein
MSRFEAGALSILTLLVEGILLVDSLRHLHEFIKHDNDIDDQHSSHQFHLIDVEFFLAIRGRLMMKQGWIAGVAIFALGLNVSCVSTESQTSQVVQQVEQSSIVDPILEQNSVVDPILAKRGTINPFLAWNQKAGRTGNRYGLTWTHNPQRSNYRQNEPIIRLTELYWSYYYPNKGWLYYPGIEPYLTSRNWGHAAEYGTTLATNINSPDFLRYIASVGADNVQSSNAHGVMLDWWHDNHQGGFSESAVRRSRQLLVRELRAALGQDAILIGNVNWRRDTATVSQINGVFLELYKDPYKLYTSSELFEMESLLRYYDERLAYPRLIALEGWRQTKAVSDADRNTSANRRMAKIITAMSVVIPANGYILYGDNNPDTPVGDHDHLYYDFYSFDVGQPTSGYNSVSRGVGFKEHDRGVVAYNISGRDVVFETSDGREVIAPANSGLFCEFVGDEERCLSLD